MRKTSILALCTLLLGACSGTTRRNADFSPPAATNSVQVAIESNAYLDMGVYVLSDNGARRRIATVTLGRTERVKLTHGDIANGKIRFLLDPIGSHNSFVTDWYSIRAGDTVQISVRQPAQFTTVFVR